MTLDEIKANPELEKKLKSIYTSLNSVLKDDVEHDKFSYRENEVSPMLEVKAVNQHIAENRMKKINALMELSENWDSFKTLYQDDNILKKIGVEFLKGKFEFDEKTIKTIKEYPHRKEVLYYFNKGVDVNMREVKGDDYSRIKEQILPSIEKESKIHLDQQTALAKALKDILSDKSQKNLEYLGSLTEGTNANNKVNVEYGTLISKALQSVNEGNFTAIQKGANIAVELPIPGVRKENVVETKFQTTVLTINLQNSKNYSFEVGSLEKPKISFEDRLQSIRKSSLGQKDIKPSNILPK